MSRTVLVPAHGTFVGKRSERLLLRGPGLAKGKPPAASPQSPPGSGEEEVPLFRVGEIVVPPRGVTLSSDLVQEAVSRGIPITFLSSTGQPYAMLTSPMLTATVQTRREQLRAMDDRRGAELCRAFVTGKLRNQAGLLVYFAKAESGERRKAAIAAASEVRRARGRALQIQGTKPAMVRESLMGVEGLGAQAYWRGVKGLLEGKCEFEGRTGRGAVDSVNALLNYGYGILTSRVWAAVMLAGLDPFAGFLHADRPGKPSMVLDLIEEMRAPVVDRAVLAYVRLGQRVSFEGALLDEPTRKAIASAVVERLESSVVVRGRKMRVGSVVQQQARSVATFVRGEGKYRTFSMAW